MLLTLSHEVKCTTNISRCIINMRKHEFQKKILFHAIYNLQNMLNTVSIKTFITYGEHATYTFMQDSYQEEACKNSSFLA